MLGLLSLTACVAVAVVAAVHGGNYSLRAIAHKEAKYFGDPNAAITRIETVRLSGGGRGHTRWAMIRMKSHHAFRVGCPSSRPGPLGLCGAHYLEVGVNLANHAAGLYWGLTASEVSAISNARHASRWFRIFPDTPALSIRCAIPRGGVQLSTSPTLTGTCTTSAEPGNDVRRVELRERFQLTPNGKPMTAGWDVTLGRSGRVRSVRAVGQPPQAWK